MTNRLLPLSCYSVRSLSAVFHEVVYCLCASYNDSLRTSLYVFFVFKVLYFIQNKLHCFGGCFADLFIVGTPQFREPNRRFELQMGSYNVTRSSWSRTWCLELHFSNRIPHTVTIKARIDVTRIIGHLLWRACTKSPLCVCGLITGGGGGGGSVLKYQFTFEEASFRHISWRACTNGCHLLIITSSDYAALREVQIISWIIQGRHNLSIISPPLVLRNGSNDYFVHICGNLQQLSTVSFIESWWVDLENQRRGKQQQESHSRLLPISFVDSYCYMHTRIRQASRKGNICCSCC